jgi:hypothetical protein
MDIPKSDILWLLVVATIAFSFVELHRRADSGEHFFAVTVALVTVATALLWVAIG